MMSKIARKLRRLNTRRTRTRCESALFVFLILGFIAFEANSVYRQQTSFQQASNGSVLPLDYQGLSPTAGLQLYKRTAYKTVAQPSQLDILSVERATLDIDPRPRIANRRPKSVPARQVVSVAAKANGTDRLPAPIADQPSIYIPAVVLPAAFDQTGPTAACSVQYPTTGSPPLTMPAAEQLEF